jgi:hypothetical protein
MVAVKEWHETTRVVSEAEERGGQHKAKEAENKSKRTHVLNKGDGQQRWRATEELIEAARERGGERQRRRATNDKTPSDMSKVGVGDAH